MKAFLEAQGYEVKGEIAGADVVGLRGDEPPVVVELKSGWSLTLFQQGIARQDATPHVYLAVPEGRGRRASGALKANLKIARRLGLGVLTVTPRGTITPRLDPGPFRPRLLARPRERLLKEFAARRGDPSPGGSAGAVVTAYRQDCLLLASHLAVAGACRGADVARATGVPRATAMMRDNHYGWFRKVERGIYGLTDLGRVCAGAGGTPVQAPLPEADGTEGILITSDRSDP
ncbi:DUF2161 family putative PD-(D/E)XK-type phosphodiesterase [Jannaschia aquimarina]|uniref:DUF2161 family putative PD-(D/E)XK-type phosphodiesterase n=1 Tax=Jannaschia aquimarina TaxID=935700 RepID=UPI003CC818A9